MDYLIGGLTLLLAAIAVFLCFRGMVWCIKKVKETFNDGNYGYMVMCCLGVIVMFKLTIAALSMLVLPFGITILGALAA